MDEDEADSNEPKLNPGIGGAEALPNDGVWGDERGAPNGDVGVAVANGDGAVVANKAAVDEKRLGVVNRDDPTPAKGDGGGAATKGD